MKTTYTIHSQAAYLRVEMAVRYLNARVSREHYEQRLRRIEVAQERAKRQHTKYYGDDDSRPE